MMYDRAAKSDGEETRRAITGGNASLWVSEVIEAAQGTSGDQPGGSELCYGGHVEQALGPSGRWQPGLIPH
jgi:hypothetical protein